MLEREIAAAGREAIMNGKRDILNVEQNVPVVVAKVELKGDMWLLSLSPSLSLCLCVCDI